MSYPGPRETLNKYRHPVFIYQENEHRNPWNFIALKNRNKLASKDYTECKCSSFLQGQGNSPLEIENSEVIEKYNNRRGKNTDYLESEMYLLR